MTTLAFESAYDDNNSFDSQDSDYDPAVDLPPPICHAYHEPLDLQSHEHMLTRSIQVGAQQLMSQSWWRRMTM